VQIGFEVTAAVPKRLRAAEEQPAQQSMRGDRKITQAPSTDQKRVRREMARKTATEVKIAGLRAQSAIYAEEDRTRCPDCGGHEKQQHYKGWGGHLSPGGEPTNSWRCADCGHHYATDMRHEDPAYGYVRQEQGRTGPSPDAGVEKYHEVRKQREADEAAAAKAKADHEEQVRRIRSRPSFVDELHQRAHASAGEVGEHDGVQAKDEFDSEHVEPGGGKHHHHHPRTAMNSYLALMNDVGDCRSCGGDLIKQPAEKGASTVTAKCADCGMEHQLQESGQRSASLRRTARQEQHLDAIAAIYEVEHSTCPDCGSKGWGTKSGEGHSNSSDRGFRWNARCRDCGHRYEVARDDNAADRRSRYASLTWEPATARYLPDPHKHMSAIARRAQSVLDTEEIQ
jgi:DNA-directed RNA polymerase subunit M/transcription elongation factor TFIIS